MSNKEKYNEIYKELIGDDALEEFDELSYGSVGWDSVMNMDLLDMMEQEFDIKISTSDKMSFDSYLSGIEILKKYDISM